MEGLWVLNLVGSEMNCGQILFCTEVVHVKYIKNAKVRGRASLLHLNCYCNMQMMHTNLMKQMPAWCDLTNQPDLKNPPVFKAII